MAKARGVESDFSFFVQSLHLDQTEQQQQKYINPENPGWPFSTVVLLIFPILSFIQNPQFEKTLIN